MLRISRRKPRSQFFAETDNPKKILLNWARRDRSAREQVRAPIDYDIFRAGYVVDSVVKVFEGRCAYCERDIGNSEGIGHYRPVNLTREATATLDHYSWLAYEWRNLFLICKRCESIRQDRFPVVGHRSPFLATLDEIEVAERPLLIDPTRENPLHHLSFLTTGECYPDNRSPKGRVTAAVFDLNDEFLLRDRRNAIEHAVSTWREIIRTANGLPDWFLEGGAFLGARRNVIARAVAEFGIEGLQVRPTVSFRRALFTLLEALRPRDRDRMLAAVDTLEAHDKLRATELRNQQPLRLADYTAVPIPSSSTNRPTFRSDIQAVRVSNLRAIDSLEIRFPKLRSTRAGAPCLLILGENSVGKSTCLSAIALALLGTRAATKLNLAYRDFGRSSGQNRWDLWGGKPVNVEVTFHDQAETAEFRYEPGREQFGGTEDLATIVLGYGPHRYIATGEAKMSSGPAERVRSLFDPRTPISDPSPWLIELARNDREKFDEVARAIRGILPVGDDDKLVNDETWGICVQAHTQLTPIIQLSEGYRSMLAVITDICRSLLEYYPNLETAKAIVLIDEIETHLHPRWKMRVMSALRRAFPRVQFVATTHDPLCLRGMDDDEVIVLTRSESGGVQLVGDLPPIAGMRVEQILTSEYFGLSSTIDPDTELRLLRAAATITTDPAMVVGQQAANLVSQITVGDTATEQIIQEALLKFLLDRERPKNDLATAARPEAVAAVVHALRAAKANRNTDD